MAAVGVAHDNELAACLFDPVTEGASVAFEPGVYHTRAMLPGNLNRAVGRAVIRNYDFSANAYVAEGVQGFVYAGRNRLHFVEAGNDDRYLDRRRPGRSPSIGGKHILQANFSCGSHASFGEACAYQDANNNAASLPVVIWVDRFGAG